jgi:predicted transcriptional regulator
MPTPDDLTPDAFARLTALEQSQELLRRAQFLDASSRARHAEALDRYAQRMDRLEHMLLRQQQLQAQVQALHDRMTDRQDQQAARQDDHAARLARLEDIAARIQLTLDAILAMLRDRNGH